MQKAIVLVAIVTIAGPVSAATWDFNDMTTQGWTLTQGVRSDSAAYVGLNPDANDGVDGGWGAPLKGFNEPADGTGALYLANGSKATMSVPSTNSFKFSAEICGDAMNVNKFFLHGMAYRHTHNKDTMTPNTLAPADAVTAWFEGRSATSERMLFNDTYNGNVTNTSMTWLKAAPPTDVTDYNITETARATIFYNWNDGAGPGEIGKIVITWEYLDYAGKSTNAAPVLVYGDLDINDATGQYHEVNMIRLGANLQSNAWSQFYADNVVFVPEPLTLAVFGLGLLPLLRRRRVQ